MEVHDRGKCRCWIVVSKNCALEHVTQATQATHVTHLTRITRITRITLCDQVLKSRAALGLNNSSSVLGGTSRGRQQGGRQQGAVGLDGLSDAEALIPPANIHRIYHVSSCAHVRLIEVLAYHVSSYATT